MEKKKRGMVEWTMHYRQIVILLVCCLVAYGIYSLPQMRKNEFPDFTIRQGLVVAVAPGYTSEQVAEQVAKPLEDFIFTYKEVRKEKTFSKSRDGIVYIQVQLNDELNDKDAFWNKFKHGIQDFKAQLPSGVVAIQVLDDFGDTSAMLVAMESESKTYRELDAYMDSLQERLRGISSVGKMTVSGLRKEQISVYLDSRRLARYGLTDIQLTSVLAGKGFASSGGRVKSTGYVSPIYVTRSFNSVYDVEQQIVCSLPDGRTVRLGDVARVVREYPSPDSYITYNGNKCLLLNIEMKKGNNIVDMGDQVKEAIDEFNRSLPADITISFITDQSQVVGDSVNNFLHELLIAIVAVVLVVMLLLPLRVALVAASTIPITIFISLGLFYTFDIELNTVTLAALIVTLGMIVDNSIVIIDNYIELLGEGGSRWHASITSTTHFFKSILSATLAISITFFPFLFTTTGMIHDFLLSFPWAITIVLGVSLLVATMLVPFMQFWFIREPIKPSTGRKFSKTAILDGLQRGYNWLIDRCFAHPKWTVGVGVLSVVLGAVLLGSLPQQLLPIADRNQFAVEITLPTGTSLERTVAVADSLEHIIRRDPRVVSVTSFKGCSSPRFQNAYAPQLPGTNFAQFIVNTVSSDATVEVLDEYAPRYTGHFAEARVRFKQLSYIDAAHAVEVRLTGTDRAVLSREADSVKQILKEVDGLENIQTDLDEPLVATGVTLREATAARMGVNNLGVETALSIHYGPGVQVATVWEGDNDVPIVVRGEHADNASALDVADEMMPVSGGLRHVPLRQVASVAPSWEEGQIVRRGGQYTVTVAADAARGENVMNLTSRVQERLDSLRLAPSVSLQYGGEQEDTNEKMPPIMSGLYLAAVIIFFILVFHFKRVSVAALIFGSILLCILGTALGVLIQDVDFSVTSILGVISLMGISVRNGIIMVDYAEELRRTEHMHAEDAIYHSALRRMRPIFLTSAAASMGVIPMILGGSSLWMPMGAVICYGTLVTMLFLLTVLPVCYQLAFRGTSKKRERSLNLEKE